MASAAFAVRLPARLYTTSDGLPNNTVTCILPDSRGFIWLCTIEGLARFDGYRFQNYGVDQGLPDPAVNVLIETRSGLLIAGTHRGMAVLKARPDERSPSRFEVYYPGPGAAEREISTLFEDRSGVLWCGTGGGLYRVRWNGSKPSFELKAQVPAVDIAQDESGNLWIAGWDQGLFELMSSGELRRYGVKEGLPPATGVAWVYSVGIDGEGRVWAGTHSGLCRLVRDPAKGGKVVERVYTKEVSWNPLAICLYRGPSGRMWIGTRGGLSEWTGDAQRPFRHWGTAEGVTDHGVNDVVEDRSGNLWVATSDLGLVRVAHDGFATYSRADGLARDRSTAYTESRDGELFAVSLAEDSLDLNRFDGDRFTSIHPALPPHIRWLGWGSGTTALQDRAGDWWVATGEGLVRFADGLRKPPKAVYTKQDGLKSNEIFKLFEDSRGDIWIATNAPTSVSRWERSSGKFRFEPVVNHDRTITSFAEDPAGNVWVGTSIGFFRWSRGRVEQMDRAGETPQSAAALLFDSGGRLWLGNRQGLFRSDDPLTGSPHFQRVLSQAARCVVEDRWGRIYACTGQGVACINPARGRIRQYTAADGLGPGMLQCGYRDRRGDLWFCLTLSASRFTPQPEAPEPPAPVYITSLRVSGRDVPLTEWGETAVGRIDLKPYENSVDVGFVGIELATGQSLEYEYRVDGAQRDWQKLGAERSVQLASLAPGAYRLLVRAVNKEGAVTDPPASVELFVATPIWRRWWSLMVMAIGLAAILYTAHRWRMRYVLELERVRTRIATDLHDDVGASLSQVAIMSEVVSRRAESEREALEEIAGASRELLQSMSEIVWAVDPTHDRLSDLTQRMRWFAGETLSACGVALHFSVAAGERELRLGVDTRRQVFLIFKECINNIARHAQARHVYVSLKVVQDYLVLEAEDDGCGFDSSQAAGHGLRNMTQRARALRGEFALRSRPDGGTHAVLRVPLAQRRPWRRRMSASA
jgi:signal transduction histidine kinase/ligand-binding sensor domain-containing protein